MAFEVTTVVVGASARNLREETGPVCVCQEFAGSIPSGAQPLGPNPLA